MNARATTDRRRLAGFGIGLLSALSYGVGTLVSRKVVSDETVPVVASAFSLLFGTVFVAGLFRGHALADFRGAPRRAWAMVSLAGLGSAWGVNLLFLALHHGTVSLVAPVAGIAPLISILLASVFLKQLERITWRVVLGGALVVLGVAVISLGQGG